MTPDAQQPQRTCHCGTCSHAETSNAKEYPFKCGISKPIPMYVHEYCVSWFQYVGCASHSTRPHTPSPDIFVHCETCRNEHRAEAARTATLAFCEEFLDYRRKHSAVYGASQTYRDEAVYVREKIESLRRTAQEHP